MEEQKGWGEEASTKIDLLRALAQARGIELPSAPPSKSPTVSFKGPGGEAEIIQPREKSENLSEDEKFPRSSSKIPEVARRKLREEFNKKSGPVLSEQSEKHYNITPDAFNLEALYQVAQVIKTNRRGLRESQLRKTYGPLVQLSKKYNKASKYLRKVGKLPALGTPGSFGAGAG